jgi:hypothetical protein
MVSCPPIPKDGGTRVTLDTSATIEAVRHVVFGIAVPAFGCLEKPAESSSSVQPNSASLVQTNPNHILCVPHPHAGSSKLKGVAFLQIDENSQTPAISLPQSVGG